MSIDDASDTGESGLESMIASVLGIVILWWWWRKGKRVQIM